MLLYFDTNLQFFLCFWTLLTFHIQIMFPFQVCFVPKFSVSRITPAWHDQLTLYIRTFYSSNFYQTIIKQKFLFFWANTYLHKQMLPILGDKMQCIDTWILWYSDFALKNQCINNAMYLSSSKPSIQRSSCTKYVFFRISVSFWGA